MFVDFNILNQLGSPSINSNTFANRPAAGQTGRLFVSIDTYEIYRDNGTTWDLIGGPGSSTVTGTGAATQVAYWTAAQSIGGSNNLWWDNTNGFLGVGSAAPTARVEAVKTDGIGIYANYTTNAGSGSSATAIYAINNTASSGYAAVIEEKTGNTTGGQYPLLVKHSLSSGTAAVGMGTGVHWQLPDDAGTFKTTQLTVETTDAAAATYKTRYRFNVQNNGSSTPVAYLNATGLGLFTATPGAALDVHSTGTIAQLNSTGTTNNTYLAFQRTGATTFSIGDTYNGGSNYFRIFGNSLSADIVRIFAATGESFFTSTETYSSGNSIGVSVQNNLTIPNGVNVGLAALGGVNSNLNLTLQGSTTVANTGRQGLEGSTSISFTGAGTLTMTQGSTVRAFSALSSVYAFNGSAVGTITHLAGLRICFPDNVGSAVNITNNYALLINNQTTGTGTVTYTNRWGIYQEGASDTNYFAATTLVGTTVNSGYKFDVSGSANATTLYENGVRVSTTANISGTTNYVPKFTSANVIGNSQIFDNGTNVGIGTATPNASFKTEILGALPAIFNVNSSVVSPTYGGILFYRQANQVGDGNGISFNLNSSTNTNVEYGYIGAEIETNTVGNNNGSLVFYPNSAGNRTKRMTLTAAGNLGIGNNSPAAPLEVNGQVRASNYTGTGYPYHGEFLGGADVSYANLQAGSTAGYATGVKVYGGGNATPNIITLQTASTERMRIFANGNVFIGSSPTDGGQKLQVNGTSKFNDSCRQTNLIGIDYSQTSTSGTTSIINTGIFYGTAIIGYGGYSLYQIFISGNPNASGSGSYANTILGYIVVCTGYSFSIPDVIQEISYVEIVNKTGSNVGSLTVTVFFWNGITETTQVVNGTTNAQIRVKVTGYNSSYVGSNQDIKIIKLN